MAGTPPVPVRLRAAALRGAAGVLFAVIVVAGAILFMVMVGMVKVADEALWLEVSSQVLNGCFTLLALCSQPVRLRNLVRAVRVVRGRSSPAQATAIARRISLDFPAVRIQLPGDETPSPSTETAPKDRPPTCTAAQFLLIIAVLNLNCVFQYPITFVMWHWIPAPQLRPSIIVYAFLPLSFLAGTAGGLALCVLGRRGKQRVADKSDAKFGAPSDV